MSYDNFIMTKANSVCRTSRILNGDSIASSTQKENTVHSSNNQMSSITRIVETGTCSMANLRRQFENQGLSRQTLEIFLASWKYSTKTHYDIFVRRW